MELFSNIVFILFYPVQDIAYFTLVSGFVDRVAILWSHRFLESVQVIVLDNTVTDPYSR